MHIRQILEEAKDINEIAVQYKDKVITYKNLYESVAKIAEMLKNYKNEIIMIYLPNSIDYYIAYFAVLELDSVILPIHVLNTVYNLNVVRNMTDSRILITTSTAFL